jgi:glucokinase
MTVSDSRPRTTGVVKYIGVDIGGTKTAVSAWTSDEELAGKQSFPTAGDHKEILDRIVLSMEELAGPVPSCLEAIGVSCGGPLDSRNGLILSPPHLPGWDGVPITKFLADRRGVPCFLENDANACALAEWYWGAGRAYRNLVFLTFGTGLGAGLILDGRLYRGTCNLAGEVGHIRLAEDGPKGYGKHGSWEGFCSGGGISRMYRDHIA